MKTTLVLVVDMSFNGSGIRDTARVLKVSQVLVMHDIVIGLFINQEEFGIDIHA